MSTTRERASKKSGIFRFADVSMAILVVLIVGMMIIPLPTRLLDVLLSLNITFAIITLLSTFYVKEALEIAAFPTILLLATLYRLALNVSTTRLTVSYTHLDIGLGFVARTVPGQIHSSVGQSLQRNRVQYRQEA